MLSWQSWQAHGTVCVHQGIGIADHILDASEYLTSFGVAGLAFRMCAWSLHAAGLPSSARQLAMGCLLLVFIHTAVLWTACQVAGSPSQLASCVHSSQEP